MYHARTESSGPPATRIAPPTPEAAKPSAAQAMPPVLYSDHDIHPPGAPPPVAVHDRSRMLSDSIMEDMFEGLPDSLDQADSAGGAGIVDSVDDVDDVDKVVDEVVDEVHPEGVNGVEGERGHFTNGGQAAALALWSRLGIS